jgi:hypothetical protein
VHENMVEITNNSVSFKLSLNTLQSLSTTLTKKAIAKGHKLETKLRDSSMHMIKSFLTGDYDNVDADSELFNFSCEEECPTLTEVIISRFKKTNDLVLMSSFLHKIAGQAKRYKDELSEVFSNICYNASIGDLVRLVITENFVRDIVENVLSFKRGYVTSTREIDVKLDDGTLAFKDVIPFTAICIDPIEKKMFYYTGPKPNVQRWIEVKMNPRLMEHLGCMTSSGQIQFVGMSVFFWIKDRKRYRLYSLDNVFDFTEELYSYDIPTSPYRIDDLQFVKSKKNKLFLLDHRTQQMYDLLTDQWMQIEEMIFPHMVRDEDYQLVNVTEKNPNHEGEKKHQILFRRETNSSLVSFASITPNYLQVPLVPFQYFIQKVDEWKVKRRLQDDKISLDPKKTFEETQQLMYHQVEPFVQYVVPGMESKDCIYTLIETNELNKAIKNESRKVSSHNAE